MSQDQSLNKEAIKEVLKKSNKIAVVLNDAEEKINKSIESVVDSIFESMEEKPKHDPSEGIAPPQKSMVEQFGNSEEWDRINKDIEALYEEDEETMSRYMDVYAKTDDSRVVTSDEIERGGLIQTIDKVEEPRLAWPDPTGKDLKNPLFHVIWECIKKWDINVPNAYVGYCGATGNHVKAIMDALNAADMVLIDKDMMEEALDDFRTALYNSLHQKNYVIGT